MFEDKEFDNMYFKIHNCDVKSEPRLAKITYMKRLKNYEQAVRFFCYAYDVGSPLVKKIKNVMDRRHMAAELAGFNLEDTVDFKRAEQYILLTSPLFVTIVQQMLAEMKHLEYTMLVTQESFFMELAGKVLDPIKNVKDDKALIDATSVKDKLSESMKKALDRINALRKEIYVDNDLIEKIKDSERYSPEDLAEMIDV